VHDVVINYLLLQALHLLLMEDCMNAVITSDVAGTAQAVAGV
jgi:hypothetical protein